MARKKPATIMAAAAALAVAAAASWQYLPLYDGMGMAQNGCAEPHGVSLDAPAGAAPDGSPLLGVLAVSGAKQAGPSASNGTIPDVANRTGVEQGVLTRVVDGDTIDISGVRYRLSLIDTPERGEPGFWNATNEVKRLCPQNSTVYYDNDDLEQTDRYGRHLGVVWCAGNQYNSTVGEHLYNLGLAEFFHRYCESAEAATKEWAEIHGYFYRNMCGGCFDGAG